MKYRCYHCNWRGHADEVNWTPQWVNSEAWGIVANQRSEYAACPECDSDDVGEVEEKDPDELRETLVEIARAGGGL